MTLLVLLVVIMSCLGIGIPTLMLNNKNNFRKTFKFKSENSQGRIMKGIEVNKGRGQEHLKTLIPRLDPKCRTMAFI
jgi:hypothetical protein